MLAAIDTSDPLFIQIRRALSRLVTKGVEPYWILDTTRELLDLGIVHDRASKLGLPLDDEVRVEALVDVLSNHVNQLGSRSSSILLSTVLGLNDPTLLDLAAGQRRTLAGQRFRGGRRTVTAGTIRQYHEPRALDQLASLLAAHEVQYQANGPAPPLKD